MRHPSLAATAATVALLAAVCSGCSSSTSSTSTSSAPATASASPSASASASASTSASASASASTSATAGAATVKVVATGGNLGSILVDGQGRTLYLFEADTSSQSTCSGACAAAWPPFTTTGAATAVDGATAGLLGTTKRADGATQVTYNGHPLYYYAGDAKPGDTTGQDLNQFGAGWYVLNAAGEKVEPS
ncbi:hypothetical protein OG535_24945 [Kitasatospora sp. NBC_00085]|uniref:COG4315 family predicted lipoprotein n=1 Tax=unclassified Kitasatospora TaxID=2633591 RepID=UPI0032543B20